jgi:hypothetical protein
VFGQVPQHLHQHVVLVVEGAHHQRLDPVLFHHLLGVNGIGGQVDTESHHHFVPLVSDVEQKHVGYQAHTLGKLSLDVIVVAQVVQQFQNDLLVAVIAQQTYEVWQKSDLDDLVPQLGIET